MKVIIEHRHNCECIAKAPAMGEGRDFWIGKLSEQVAGYPEETHCLHLKTEIKEVTFLCNEADFQQLQIICRVVTGEINEDWMKTMLKLAATASDTLKQNQ